MTYAQQAADAAGMPRQTWCRKVWKLQDYEAKDLLKGNASEVVWERILKLKGEHCGWHVALPVLAAVIGTPVHAFFQDQMKQAAKAAAHAEEPNASHKPPTGVWRALLLILAKVGGRGAALERWALKRLGVWPEL